MKNLKLLALLLPTSLLIVACKPDNETPPAAAQAAADQKMADAKAETKAAAQDFKDYTYAKKAEYIQAMRDELAEVNKQIDDLKAKIAQSSDDVKTAAQPKLDALYAEADKLKVQLDKAGDATESTWDSFKAGSAQAYDDVKKSLNDARQWLSDKIAPAKST